MLNLISQITNPNHVALVQIGRFLRVYGDLFKVPNYNKLTFWATLKNIPKNKNCCGYVWPTYLW